MGAGASLLEEMGALIERTYDFRSGLGPLERFVVGDAGFRRLVAGREVVRSVESPASGAQVLIRPRDRGWAAALYYPDDLIERLERRDPRKGLDEENLLDFAVFTEELDHLLTLADRAGPRRPPVSLLELEWHAEVTQYLACAHFRARTLRRRRLDAGQRAWLRRLLFEGRRLAESEPEIQERYLTARRQAVRFLDTLEGLGPAERLRRLRTFHRASHQEKLRLS